MQNDHFVPDAMHVAVPRAAGVDVHKMQLTAAVRVYGRDGEDAQASIRIFGTDPPALREFTNWLNSHAVTSAVMEGTGVYWIAPFRALEDAGICPQLVHAQHVKQIKGRKTDIQDAVWLARVCQFGLARPSYVPPREFSELRQQCRYRRTVVADRARIRNRLQKTLDHDGLRLGGLLSDLLGLNGRRILDGLVQGHSVERILKKLTWHMRDKLEPIARTLEAELSDAALWRLSFLLKDFDAANERLQDLDALVGNALQPWERELDLLQTIPGIGSSSAHAIFAELGPEPTKVFPNAASLAAWAGVCPGNNESAGKRRSGRVRAGNKALRATLTECALGAARTSSSQFHGYYDNMKARINHKRAVLATAHKLLRTIYAILRDDHPYRDPKVNYESLLVERNASRWIRMLTKHNYLNEVRAIA